MGVNGIYGLSGSGLDIESMVKVGMMSKQNQYDKMQQKYTKNEWIKAAYIETYGTIQTFNNSTLSKYKMSNTMNAKNATSSQEAVVTATANANAANMTHVVEVGQLASAAYLVGTQSLERLGDNESSIALKDSLFFTFEKNENGEVVLRDINNKRATETDLTATAFSFTLNDGVNGVMTNSASDAVTVTANTDVVEGQSYEIEITELAKPAEVTFGALSGVTESTHIVTSMVDMFKSTMDETATFDNIQEKFTTLLTQDGKFLNDSAVTLNFNDGKNDVSVSFTYAELLNTDTTFSDLISKIQNALSDTNIIASYEDTDDGLQLSLTQKESGSNNTIAFGFELDETAYALDSFWNSLDKTFFDSIISAEGNSESFSKDGYSIDIAGSNAEGTITLLDENGLTTDVSDTLTFDANNMAKYENLTIVANALTNEPAKIETVKPIEIAVTYQQLLDGYTFNDLVSAINNAGTNVKAVYDSVQDKFSFYNKESGEKHQIGFNFASGSDAVNRRTANFFSKMDLRESIDGELADRIKFDLDKGMTIAVTGQDAKVKIDGVDMSIDANTVNVAGVVYKFTGTNATTYKDDEGNVKVKTLNNKAEVVISQDTNEIVENVKSFIEDYNNLLSKLQDLYNEKPYTTYAPLTDAQKAEMTDEQIEKWEEKARSGMLYHDQTLGRIIDKMRDTVSGTVYGLNSKYTNIYSIGISTTGTKGQLTLDEDKLRAALADDPDAVYNIFATLDDDDRSDYNGVAQRLGDIFSAGMKSIKTRSGTTADTSEDSDLNNLLRELQTKMSNFRTIMNAFEDALYKKYDKMEVALSTLGAQLNYVTTAFSN